MITIHERPQEVEQERIRHVFPVSQKDLNGAFTVVLAAMGAILAFVNALPNGEAAESILIVGYVVVMALVFLANRTGWPAAVTITTWILLVMTPLTLIIAFAQPLPSGMWALNWSYDAGLFALIPGALLATLVYRPLSAVLWVLATILLVSGYCCFGMPHAASLPGTDIVGGIISPHWSVALQYQYSLFDFLCRPVLITGAVTGIGIWLRLRLQHAAV